MITEFPGGHAGEEYDAAMARLVEARDASEGEARRLHERHARLKLSVAATLQRAEAAVAAAAARVRAAEALAEQVDADVTGVWRAAIGAVPTRVASSKEPLPEPAPGPSSEPPPGATPPRPGATIARLLGEAHLALAELRQARRPTPRLYAQLCAIGAVAGGASYLIALLVGAIGHALGAPLEATLISAGRMLALLSPLAGAPAALSLLRGEKLRCGVLEVVATIGSGAIVAYGGALLAH